MSKWPEKDHMMVIEVTWDPQSHKYGLWKPEDAGRFANLYNIEENRDGEPIVWVNWDWNGPGGPAYLGFECSFDQITGVGFAENPDNIKPISKKGDCGSGFFLYYDLPDTSGLAVVENWGHQRPNQKPFHFGLRFARLGHLPPSVFDPQIYNDGVIHDPDGGPRKERKKEG